MFEEVRSQKLIIDVDTRAIGKPVNHFRLSSGSRDPGRQHFSRALHRKEEEYECVNISVCRTYIYIYMNVYVLLLRAAYSRVPRLTLRDYSRLA